MSTAPPTLRVFGGVRAIGPDGEIDLGGPKQRAVLVALLLQPGTVVPLDRIVDALWGDEPPTRAEVSVRGYVSNLRKALVATGTDAEDVIQFRERGYVLHVEPNAIDLHRFEELVRDGLAAGRLGQAKEARRHLTDALALWTGSPFGAAGDDLELVDVAGRLEQRRGDAVEALTELRLAAGEHDAVVGDLPAEITHHPYRERLRIQFATALYRGGRPVEALRSIEDARRALADDIGVEPGPDLRAVEAAILDHDESLTWHAPVATPPATTATSAAPTPTPTQESADPADPADRLYGRDAEVATVVEILDRLATSGEPGGRSLIVSGEAGIGKTALVRRLRVEAARRGVPVGWGRCPESAGAAPYRSWRMAIAQLPSTDTAAALDAALSAGDELTDRSEPLAARLATHTAVVDQLRALPPSVVVIDDLQWADDATLALLEFLGPELEALPLLLGVTVRRSGPTDLPAGVRDCLAELVRGTGSVQLNLEGLDGASVGEWVGRAVGGRPASELAPFLTRTTDGNPFYLRELLALLEAEGRLQPGVAVASTAVPVAVQDVVRRRTSRLPPETQAALAVAAVIGRRFDADILAAVIDPDLGAGSMARLLDDLDPALGVGLIEPDESSVGRFAFSHALVAETLVAEQSAVGRARLHARIAQTIARVRADSLDQWLGDLAVHACAGAAAGTAREAIEYSIAAADVAEHSQASADVAAHLQRALAVMATSGDDTPSRRIELLTRMGIASRESGDVTTGRTALVDAALVAESIGDDVAVAAALSALCTDDVWAGIEWSQCDQRAVALIERMLQRSGDAAPVVRARLESTLAGELIYLDPTRARDISAQAVESAERADDQVVLAQVLLQRYWGLHGPDFVTERARIGERMTALADGGGLPDRLVPLAHLVRAATAYDLGDRATLDRCADRARATSHPVRTPVAWAHVLYLETSFAVLAGDLERAAELAVELREVFWRVRRFTAVTTTAAILAVVRTEQGRFDAALAEIAVLEDSIYQASIQWMKAWVLAEAGRDDEARVALSSFGGELGDDWLRTPITVAAVLAATKVGEMDFLRRHLGSLDRVADRFVSLGGGGVTFGPVAYARAEGLAALGDRDAAIEALGVARALATDMRARLWLARIEDLSTRLQS